MVSLHTITYDTEEEAIAAATKGWNNRADNWIKATDKRPILEDGDNVGDVLWWDDVAGYSESNSWWVERESYTYWQPLPSSPKEDRQ
jgi:hypothetical protein